MARLSGNAKGLAIALVAYVASGILLTPAGLETRPSSNVTTVGMATLVLFLAGLVLALVSLALLRSRPRRSQMTSIIAAILYFPALIGDQAGLLSTMKPPTVIFFLELVNALVAVTIIVLAARAGMEKQASSPTG